MKNVGTDGITVKLHGTEWNFRPALLAFLGDNLASTGLAGIFLCFSLLKLRSDAKHDEQCNFLDGPLRDHYSKTYGINRRSILSQIPYFSMFSGSLPHIMHDILEGLAALDMSLLLHHCIISEAYLSFDDYNYRLIHFDYGYTESNKPTPMINRSVIADKRALQLSASQSLLLIRILPLMIGDVIPNDDANWK